MQSNSVMSRYVSKADFQNKKKEEDLMWKMRQNVHVNKRKFNQNNTDDDNESSDNQQSCSKKSYKNNWMKKLVNAESKQPERWGHDGYKELYPEEFSSSSSDESSNKKKKSKKMKKKQNKIIEKINKKKKKSHKKKKKTK
uniref:Uncharacterized protein NKAPD1-like isoform X2 n=1 Tax=Dermatophagoides pteronyssinus TaxID=6956 RepID=A0A6P6YIZ9_DERPT|nr:uncharacterized protein NKAPD1-like isoform X2 [Dermatophagoides pteronyssinus]